MTASASTRLLPHASVTRPPEVVIPPRASSVISAKIKTDRSAHREGGPHGLQKATGYGHRSLVETAIGRYKHVIGPKLWARSSDGQQGEVAIAVQVLNRMIRTAKPISVRPT